MVKVWSLDGVAKDSDELPNKTNGSVECYNRETKSEFARKPNLIEFADKMEVHSRKWVDLLHSSIDDEAEQKDYSLAVIPEVPAGYKKFKPPVKVKRKGAFNKKKNTAYKRARWGELANSIE